MLAVAKLYGKLVSGIDPCERAEQKGDERNKGDSSLISTGALHAHADVSMAPKEDPNRGGDRRGVSNKGGNFYFFLVRANKKTRYDVYRLDSQSP